MTTLTTCRRTELAAGLARSLSRMGIRVPALWLLELYKPLGFLGAQALLFLQPVLGVWTGDEVIRDYVTLLEEPTGIEQLLAELEKGDSHAATDEQPT